MSLGSPLLYTAPVVDLRTGLLTRPWQQFLAMLLARIGGPGEALTNTDLAALLSLLPDVPRVPVAQDPDPFTVGPPVPGTALDPFGARPSSRRPDPDPWGGGLAAALPDPDPFAAPPLACPERPSDASLAGLLAQLALLQDAAPALEQAVQAHLATLQQALDEMQTALAFGPPPPVSDQSSGTFTATATGCSAGVTGTARWDKHGTSVLLYLPQLSGTSTSTAFTVTGIPAALEPTRAAYQLVRAVDNGAEVMGLLEAGVTPSTFTLYASSGGASWTASGAKILQACWVAYALL